MNVVKEYNHEQKHDVFVDKSKFKNGEFMLSQVLIMMRLPNNVQ